LESAVSRKQHEPEQVEGEKEEEMDIYIDIMREEREREERVSVAGKVTVYFTYIRLENSCDDLLLHYFN
jgi:hypothetical protein